MAISSSKFSSVRGRGIDIRVLGSIELQRVLDSIPFKVQKKVLRPALRAAAKIVRKDVKRLAPKSDKRRRSGKHLKDTIRVRAGKRKRGVTRIQVQTGSRAELGISATDKYYYPMAIEYGRRKTGSGVGIIRSLTAAARKAFRRSGSFMGNNELHARPFMRPAINQNERRVRAIIKVRLRKEIRKLRPKALPIAKLAA